MSLPRGVIQVRNAEPELLICLVESRSHKSDSDLSDQVDPDPPDVSQPPGGHGAEQVHHPLPVAGRHLGRGRSANLPGRDLRPVELLGLLRLLRAPADLPQPHPLDLLVHGEPDRVRGGAQLGQAGYPVTWTTGG